LRVTRGSLSGTEERGETQAQPEPPRTEEQDVAGGVVGETPAVALVTVIASIAGVVVLVLAVAALAYWLA
jgi:hypothetical protein